jgi:hypothetical protein
MNKTDIQNLLQVPNEQKETMFAVLDCAEHGSVERVTIEDKNDEADEAEQKANADKKFFSIFIGAAGFNNLEKAVVVAPEGTRFDTFSDPEDGTSYARISFYN